MVESDEHDLAIRGPCTDRPEHGERDLDTLAAIHLGDTDTRPPGSCLGNGKALDRRQIGAAESRKRYRQE
jgi:hypothetical protein